MANVSSDFNKALQLTLDLEGRIFTNHPLDQGGPTYCGLTQDTYNAYAKYKSLPLPRNVGSLTDSEVATVYQAMFWNLPQTSTGQPICSLLPFPANVVFFQLNVSVGGGMATKLLQASINALPDGAFGPASIRCLEVGGDVSAFLLTAQLAHYATVASQWDREGLFNRVQRVCGFVNSSLPAHAKPAN